MYIWIIYVSVELSNSYFKINFSGLYIKSLLFVYWFLGPDLIVTVTAAVVVAKLFKFYLISTHCEAYIKALLTDEKF